MFRLRHRAAIVVGVAAIGLTVATVETPAHVVGSPVVALALAGIATAATLERQASRG